MTFLKVVSLKNLPLTFLHFLNVVIPMKVLWTRSTSAKHTRQKMKCKEWTIKKPFCNITRWTITQSTFGHDPKVLYVKWSKRPSSGHFYAAATETLLLAE